MSLDRLRIEQGKPNLFYDGGCPLCSREIAHYRRVDKDHKINWIDLTKHQTLLDEVGINYHAAMKRIHCIDKHGKMQIGVEAFLVIWENMRGYHRLAKLIRTCRLTKPLNFLYDRFANYRFRQRCEGSCATK